MKRSVEKLRTASNVRKRDTATGNEKSEREQARASDTTAKEDVKPKANEQLSARAKPMQVERIVLQKDRPISITSQRRQLMRNGKMDSREVPVRESTRRRWTTFLG